MWAVQGAVLVAAAVVFVVCVVLVLHKDYEDGLVGRVSLAAMGVAGLARLCVLIADWGAAAINPIGVLLWVGLALFLARHLCRFLRWRRYGDHEWRASRRAHVAGKM